MGGNAGLNNVAFDIKNNVLKISLTGDFVAFEASTDLYQKLENNKFDKIVVNGDKINKWDSSLLLFFFNVEKNKNNNVIKYEKMPSGLIKMLKLALSVPKHIDAKYEKKPESALEKFGGFGLYIWQNISKGLNFINECFKALWLFIQGKSSAKKSDFMLIFEDCGPNAMNIVILIS